MRKEKTQKYLKRKGLIGLITFMNMIAPLSLDMYLPAVPHMTQVFDTTESVVNYTLVGFFFFMAVGIILFGPLSDKYGRKALLITGTALYLVASGACAIAGSIEFLIAARILQALGAGCMMAISTALIKDCFDEKTRSTVLAVVQAMSVIAPMAAPILGAWIITVSGWRMTFWALVIMSAFCLAASFLLEESLDKEDRTQGNVLKSMSGLFKVAQNKAFTVYLLIASILTAPYMAYISVCSYIYIDYFALSETTYSYFFAANSAVAVLGPVIYIKSEGRIAPKKFMTIGVIGALASGLLVVTLGHIAAFLFLLAYMPFTIMESAIRPFSTAVLLEQQDKDTGSASALINFTHTVLGSLGMLLGALGWSSFITGVGVLIISFSALSALGWIYTLKSGMRIQGLTR